MAKNLKPTIESDLVRELAGLLDEIGLSEIEYGTDGLSIRVAKHAVASTVGVSHAAAPALSLHSTVFALTSWMLLPRPSSMSQHASRCSVGPRTADRPMRSRMF